MESNQFILESYELIIGLSTSFVLGIILGMYITTQIGNWIDNNIRNNE